MERSPLEQLIELYRHRPSIPTSPSVLSDVATAIECALGEERSVQAAALVTYHDEAWSDGYQSGYKRALDEATDGTLKALRACEDAPMPPRSPITRADVIRARLQELGALGKNASELLAELNERVTELIRRADRLEQRLRQEPAR